MFLATNDDPELADWARRIVNRLMARDVEGRLLLPAVPDDLHLTRPATPSEASVRALAPDVIVAIDDTAEAQAQQWCRDNRSTVVVRFDRSLSSAIELVSWRVGSASGRVRATIGPLVDAPALASLVRRLCAGPQPGPPRDRPTSQKPVFLRQPERETRARTCALVTGQLDVLARHRLAAISDHMQAAGMAVATFAVADGLPESVADAAFVMLSGAGLGATVEPVVAARRDRHLPTVLDLQPRDLVAVDGNQPALDGEIAKLARACGHVTSFGGALHRAATELDVRALAVPTMLTRRQVAELRAARAPASIRRSS